MRQRISHTRRGGSILPLVALCLVGLIGMVALAVDVGLIAVSRTQAQSAADVAALAGARQLTGQDPGADGSPNNVTSAVSKATAAVTNNSVMGTAIDSAQVTIQPNVYIYDSVAKKFNPMYPAPATRPT